MPVGLLAGAAIIVLAVFFAYLPSINGGFILDDDLLLTNNDLIKADDGLYRFWFTTEALEYYPVTYTLFWFEWRMWGMNPAGYHAINLILHIVESWLIWIILRKLSISGAFLAAVIFIAHPVNVESVAWISQLRNMLAMLFFLLSILWYLKFIERAHRPCFAWYPFAAKPIPKPQSLIPIHWYCLSLTAFVLAMLSKGSAAVLPVVLLMIVWWLRPLARRDMAWVAPFFAVSAILSLVNIWFQTHGSWEVIRHANFLERLLGAGGVLWFYLYKAILPLDLDFVYPQWSIKTGNPLWWLPLLAALAVTAVLWRYRKTWGRPFLFAWGFFCLSLLPVMGFTDVGFMKVTLVSDHYQHIAIIGVIAMAAAALSTWHRFTQGETIRATTALAVAGVAILAFLTWRQNGLYHNEITLYQATLEKNPNCWLVHNNLGIALIAAGRPQDAIAHYQRALAIKSDYPQALNNLGNAMIQAGRPAEAIEYCQKALRFDPGFYEAYYNLGNAYSHTGRPQEAIEYYRQALALKPGYTEAHNNLGAALVRTGRFLEAIEQCQKALLLNPRIAETHYNLGNALFQSGRIEEAIDHYQIALALRPDYPEVHNNLGSALIKAGRPREAIDHYKQDLRLKPNDASLYINLALTYASVKQSSEAIAAAQKAIELARSQGQTELARQIEDWLNTYRAGLTSPPDKPPSQTGSPP